jgi:predicted ATPase/class 3 adenylate cyclase
MEGERRNVTILFCDVKGSTTLAEQLDPEEWAEIMNGAFERLIRPVYAFEGTVARLMGDAILAFFGAPIAHEDDPQRAVLAGLGIVAAVQDYRARIQRDYHLDFNVRVGIHTGLVVVGAIGSDLRMEYTAMGDAVNLAARMEQTAQPGTVQISARTYRLVAPLFEVEDLGGIEVKGKAEPVHAYRVLRAAEQPGSLRGLAGLASPLVERAHEAGALARALDELQQGRGQIVTVMGEAGLGKSRLVGEARQAHSGLRWLDGRSLSFESATPYSAFAGLLNRLVGIRPDQPDQERYSRLVSALAADLPPARVELLAPALANLLGIALSGDALERVRYLEPAQVRARIFDAVAEWFEAMPAAGPLVLAFDDVHWSDPTSLDLLHTLLPLAARVPLALILVFRPNPQEQAWGLHETAAREHAPVYTSIVLRPLSEAGARELVANLLHIEDLPERVRSLILAKAEGNPFFVEEVIRALLDADVVVRVADRWQATREIETIHVPDTIAGVITARLDRLDERARRVAQTAAVVGREVPQAALAAVYERPDELEPGLQSLLQRELLREKASGPERTFSFKHVLTQETVYASILLRQRRDLHRRVGAALEHLAPDRPAEIARHFQEAREPGRALPYLLDAADQAARNYSVREAIGLYEQALELLKSADQAGLARRAYEGLGGAVTLANEFPRAVEVYQSMLGYAQARADQPAQISALNKLAFIHALRMGQFAQADASLREAERLAREASDRAGLSELFTIRCQMCTATADFEGVVRYMGESVALGREAGSKHQQAVGLEHIASTLIFMGRFDEAWPKAEEALALSREAGDRHTESAVLGAVAPLYHMRNGDFASARAAALQGAEIGLRIGVAYPTVYALWGLGALALQQGDYEQALNHLKQAVEWALPVEDHVPFMAVQPLGTLGSALLEISPRLKPQAAEYHEHALRLLDHPAGAFGGGTAWADIGMCALAAGNLPLAEDVFDRGLNNPSMFMLLERPRFLVGRAVIALAHGRLADAAECVQAARQFAAERRMQNAYPVIEYAAGLVAAAQGNLEGALAAYAEAEAQAARLTLRPLLWRVHAEAARALAALGRAAEAEARAAAARAVVAEMADLFKDDELRRLYAEHASAALAATLQPAALAQPEPG